MTNTAQEALKTFMNYRKTSTVAWSSLTSAQKQAHILEREGLEIAAEREIYQNQLESEAQAVTDAQTRRQQAITYLTNHGFACDNSLSDWQKLYNHPKIFGANWGEQAQYQFDLGKDLDYFISVAYGFWVEYVKNA